MNRRVPLLLLLTFSAALAGCHPSGQDQTPLRYAYSPEAEQVPAGFQSDRLATYLQKQLHRPVEIVRIEGYAATIDAMQAGKVDVASFGPLAYVIAAKKAGAQAIVSRGNADGTLGGYYSEIAVPRDSSLHSLADLQAHAHDVIFSFSDPASASGNLYPRAELLSLHIDPERDFKRIVYAGSHMGSLLAIQSAKVDAGAFEASFAERLIATGKMDGNDIHVLWRSTLIPNGPTAVRASLDPQLKQALQDAMTGMQKNDPKLWDQMNSSFRDQHVRTIAVKDSDYDQLRSYASAVKGFQLPDR